MRFQKKRRMMTKISLIVLFVLFLNSPSLLFAQPRIKDSTEAYNYWAKRGIVEMVFAYMNDYIETVGKDRARNEIVSRDKYWNNYISVINSSNNITSFDTISTFLKNNSWSETEKILFKPLVKNYKRNIDLDSCFFSVKKPGSNNLITVIPGSTNKNTNWHEKENKIIVTYNDLLAELSKKNSQKKETAKMQPTPPPKEEVAPKTQGEETYNNSNFIQWIIYLSVFIIGLLIGGWLIYILIKRRTTIILDSVDKKLKKIDTEKRNLQNNENNSFKLNALKDEIEKLKRENGVLKKKESQSDFISQKPDSKLENSYEWEINQTETAKRKLFFSMPESDGRFIINNGEPSNDGRKYFRIEYIEGSETGELYYISGDRDKKAINRLDSYLKPACDIDNITNADSATNIESMNPGKVSLINDSWVIDSNNKAQIKLL